jgi:hypothetical protein
VEARVGVAVGLVADTGALVGAPVSLDASGTADGVAAVQATTRNTSPTLVG